MQANCIQKAILRIGRETLLECFGETGQEILTSWPNQNDFPDELVKIYLDLAKNKEQAMMAGMIVLGEILFDRFSKCDNCEKASMELSLCLNDLRENRRQYASN
jgi:hypothetical protein